MSRNRLFIAAAVCALLAPGCRDMYDGHHLKPLEGSRFFADNNSSRPLPEGSVPRGALPPGTLLATGRVNGQPADFFPFPVTQAVMARGQDRFNTFCSPCHGRLGDGTGIVVQRGFPKPLSFHADSVRNKPAGFFFDVMTNGFGRMYSFAAAIPVHDRWAIAAYIRALQFSRRVPAGDLTANDRRALEGGGR